MEIVLAWVVVTLVGVFLGVPLLGGLINLPSRGFNSGYWEDFMVGAVVVGASFGVFLVMWSGNTLVEFYSS